MSLIANSAESVKNLVQTGAADNTGFEVTRGMKGLCVSIMSKLLGSDDMRYVVLAWLFDAPTTHMSSRVLSDNQWRGLIGWINPMKDAETGEWLTPATLSEEMALVAEAAIRDFGTRMKGSNNEDQEYAEYLKEKRKPFAEREGPNVYSTVEDRRKKPIFRFFPEDEDIF